MKVLKVAHENLLEWFEMQCIGIYSGLFGILGFQGFGSTSSILAQYKWRLAKDWEATIKRAITVIIMLATK